VGNTLLPLIISPTSSRSIINLKTRQSAIYDGNYNIIIDWKTGIYTVNYECLLIRATGFNIIGRESGTINGAILALGQISTAYVYDTIGTIVSAVDNPTTVTSLLTSTRTLQKIQVTNSGGVKKIQMLPIAEVDSVNPSYFDITVENYKELNP
jgi:hypothetical protein